MWLFSFPDAPDLIVFKVITTNLQRQVLYFMHWWSTTTISGLPLRNGKTQICPTNETNSVFFIPFKPLQTFVQAVAKSYFWWCDKWWSFHANIESWKEELVPQQFNRVKALIDSNSTLILVTPMCLKSSIYFCFWFVTSYINTVTSWLIYLIYRMYFYSTAQTDSRWQNKR